MKAFLVSFFILLNLGLSAHTIIFKDLRVVYGTLFFGMAAGALYYHVQALKQNQVYREGITNTYRNSFLYNPYLDDSKSVNFYLYGRGFLQGLYDEYQTNLTRRDQFLAGAAGIYLIQLFHTFYKVKLIREESENLRLSLMVFPASINPQIGSSTGMDSYFLLQWRF